MLLSNTLLFGSLAATGLAAVIAPPNTPMRPDESWTSMGTRQLGSEPADSMFTSLLNRLLGSQSSSSSSHDSPGRADKKDSESLIMDVRSDDSKKSSGSKEQDKQGRGKR
ncbi:hypothetical protein BJ508DRAFT_377203 [Ascobolus immersus RN42]|uniref:Uncharacterized protein n=1 Tax=Ascobolus immersus RN42 TaxID=1160509 RepID=A0A3N4I2A9_ASCIM|nr:hypothetical protein BJ508DRAFT_377203 [Ascobolus immersus RN42]